jgi:hypothetical protein
MKLYQSLMLIQLMIIFLLSQILQLETCQMFLKCLMNHLQFELHRLSGVSKWSAA